MKTRHVFSTRDIDAAEAAVKALRQAGLPDQDISLIARYDIERDQISEDQLTDSGNFRRGGAKGLLAGGGSGLLVGLVAIAVPALGLTLAGAVAMTAVGAAMGSWIGMLTGISQPGPIRQKFEDEIASGCVLVAVDGEEADLATADSTLLALGAVPLPFEAPTAIS